MKKLNLILAGLALAGASSVSMAATNLTDDFVVSVTFTSSCTVSQAASDLAFTYTAFAAAQTKTTTTKFDCTRGLTPVFSFDATDATQTASAAAGTGTGITAEGLIAGLRYRVTGATSVAAGTAAAAGAAGATGTNGTADTYSVLISATLAGNQAGDASSAVTQQTRVLTITY
jgi:hypothetical protein